MTDNFCQSVSVYYINCQYPDSLSNIDQLLKPEYKQENRETTIELCHRVHGTFIAK